jgi:hypothetical protein
MSRPDIPHFSVLEHLLPYLLETYAVYGFFRLFEWTPRGRHQSVLGVQYILYCLVFIPF